MFHQNIRLPGVYMFNNTSNTGGMQGAPIFCTMGADLSYLGMNDASDKVLVFPKYKVIFYPDAMDVSPTIIDNSGTKCIYQAGPLSGSGAGNASACRVYYNGEEILNVFSTTGN